MSIDIQEERRHSEDVIFRATGVGNITVSFCDENDPVIQLHLLNQEVTILSQDQLNSMVGLLQRVQEECDKQNKSSRQLSLHDLLSMPAMTINEGFKPSPIKSSIPYSVPKTRYPQRKENGLKVQARRRIHLGVPSLTRDQIAMEILILRHEKRLTFAQIAKNFKERGVPTQKGGPWTIGNLNYYYHFAMAKNPAKEQQVVMF